MTSAFERLDISVKNILWDMKWTKLFPFQVQTINNWFDTEGDIIVMASTASGKTEAAFLPIISDLAKDSGAGSIRVLYIGPLKALINDQFQRLEELCQRSDIPVHRWHGDVGGHKKKKLIKNPNGILLITPESLESVLMRHGKDGRRLFKNLDAIVIDEMHVFLDSERGRQLSSQIARLDNIRSGLTKTRRIGLSATIGDKTLAAKWLSNLACKHTALIESKKANDAELVLKTFLESSHKKKSISDEYASEHSKQQQLESLESNSALLSISEHILETFTQKTNLVFCNRKTQIEQLADYLSMLCRDQKLPNNYMVHHGSLSKSYREEVEEQLKSDRPCTAICSSTLELGIDIGNAEIIGQIGPPHGVSALKQRLGRSGRRDGQISKMIMYMPLIKCTDKSPLPDKLYPKLIQAIALIYLMTGQGTGEKWVEPPEEFPFDFSTLIQQILSVIVEKGGIKTENIYELLCSSYSFSVLSTSVFMKLLRDMGQSNLIEQVPTGELILGIEGERIANNYNFYAAFETPSVYDVVSNSGSIGTVEGMQGFYEPKQYMLLAGKRWKITDVDEVICKIYVVKARGKRLVEWSGEAGGIHKKVREMMFKLLCQNQTPTWLEANSYNTFQAASNDFHHYNLTDKRVIREGNQIHIFTWTSTKANHTLELLFRSAGLNAGNLSDEGVCLTVSDNALEISDIENILEEFIAGGIDPMSLVEQAFVDGVPPIGKYGYCLSKKLNLLAYIAKYVNMNEAVQTAREILHSLK